MAGSVEVIEVESPKLLERFIKLPWKLYKNDPNWVAPLLSERKEFFNKEKNPFFRTAKTKLFLARQDGAYVGRIATCINFNHNEYHGENIGFFGFFDTIDDYEVARALLKVAMITLKSDGVTAMRGPASFSTNHEIGFLVDGFDSPPVIMMPYNPPFLPKFAEKFGLKKVMDLFAYMLTDNQPLNERHVNLLDKLKTKYNITIRSLNMARFKEEISLVNKIYNDAWQYNWGFVPMKEDEFAHLAKGMKDIVDPNLVLIASIGDEPAAFSLALPDMNKVLIDINGRLFPTGLIKLLWNAKVKKKVDGLRLITFGVVPKFQKRGIDSIMYVETYRRGIARGYKWAELSWILETNDLMNRAAEAMGARVYKKYRMVEMPL
jgi:ribosomal protein S18 acetylase RimI-like enzyme